MNYADVRLLVDEAPRHLLGSGYMFRLWAAERLLLFKSIVCNKKLS